MIGLKFGILQYIEMVEKQTIDHTFKNVFKDGATTIFSK